MKMTRTPRTQSLAKKKGKRMACLERRGLQFRFEQRSREPLDLDSLEWSQFLRRSRKSIDHTEARRLGSAA
jgi:hypothetical protein